MFGKKAQAAMEFLMTYGWAILIVLAVIATLTSFGVLNTDIFVPAKCVIGSVGNINCVNYKVDTKGGIYFKLENGGGAGDIKISSFKLQNGDLADKTCGGDFATPLTFSAHKQVSFYVGGTSAVDTNSVVCTNFADKSEGKKVKAEIKMTYATTADPSVPHVFSGELVAPVEPRVSACVGELLGACSTFTVGATGTCPTTRGCTAGTACTGTVKQCGEYTKDTCPAVVCSWT